MILCDPQITLTSLGQTYLLRASVLDQYGSVMTSVSLDLSWSDTDVATVAPNCVVTAVQKGPTKTAERQL